MTDGYAVYTADGITINVYPNAGAAGCEICVHENGDYRCVCGFCAPCSCWN